MGLGLFLLLPGRLFAGKRVRRRTETEDRAAAAGLKAGLSRCAAVFRDLYDSMGRPSGNGTEENPAILFDRAAEDDELCAGVCGGLRLFGKTACRAAVFGDQEADGELFQQGAVQRVGEGPLHGDDIFVGDVCLLAGSDAFRRGQHAGEQPFRLHGGKGGKLFGPGGQQDIPGGFGQKGGGVGRTGKGHASGGQRALGAQQAVVFHPGGGAGGTDVPGGIHRVGVGGIHAQIHAMQQGGHLLRGQPPAVDGDAGSFALFLGPQRGGHADQYLGPQCGQLLRKHTALGGAAEYHGPHARYPRGVTIRPLSWRVWALPTNTVVNISTGVVSSAASVRTRLSCPSRPMFRTMPQTVPGALPFASRMRTARAR